MALEIERKFLIATDKLPALDNGIPIVQGYIPTSNGTTVRVRIAGEQGFICVKSRKTQLSRNEYEFPIPIADARELLANACHDRRIEKHRFLIPQQELKWEIDVFHGSNKGLIVAEIELQSEDQIFALPDWICDEVTYDNKYSNFNLTIHPYSHWE